MNYLKHLKVVLIHKWYVGVECFRNGLYWQGIVHDLSKFSPTEFGESARYFQGDSSPVDASTKANGYSKAWLHHKGHNKHHWEYWTDFYDGEAKGVPIPIEYVAEMACDMIGAGKAYNKGKWSTQEPLNYFDEHEHDWVMDKQSKRFLEVFLRNYANTGSITG